MARTRISDPNDRNTITGKVNDRIHKRMKILSVASETPVSVLVTHALAEYIDRHKATIDEFLAEDSAEELPVAAE